MGNIQTLPNYLLPIKNWVLPRIIGLDRVGYPLPNGYGHPYLRLTNFVTRLDFLKYPIFDIYLFLQIIPFTFLTYAKSPLFQPPKHISYGPVNSSFTHHAMRWRKQGPFIMLLSQRKS